jgi:hypothetical protein
MNGCRTNDSVAPLNFVDSRFLVPGYVLIGTTTIARMLLKEILLFFGRYDQSKRDNEIVIESWK